MADKIKLDRLKIYLGIKVLAPDHRERWREMGQWSGGKSPTESTYWQRRWSGFFGQRDIYSSLLNFCLAPEHVGGIRAFVKKMGETQGPRLIAGTCITSRRMGKTFVFPSIGGDHISASSEFLRGVKPVLKKINCGTWFNFTAALITWKITKRTDDKIQAHCNGSMKVLQPDVESTT